MKAFQYASPATEAQALGLLGSRWGQSEVLAGGTDLLSLLKSYVTTPDLVVDISRVESIRTIGRGSDGLAMGAMVTLDELLASPDLAEHSAVVQAAESVASAQIRARATVGGDLCQRPRCWYFRTGYGLLAMQNGESLVVEGDNRYHAILGNGGPALFVSPSTLAPALIALGAEVRIVGPGADDEQTVPLKYFYVTPKREDQRETVLLPNQLVTHVLLPPADGVASGSYHVKQLAADWPVVSAAASLRTEGGVVREARVVLGQVAPTPWVADEAARQLVGRPVTVATAAAAGDAAVARAVPLSRNGYKVQMARAAVKRAVLRAAGLLEGGV